MRNYKKILLVFIYVLFLTSNISAVDFDFYQELNISDNLYNKGEYWKYLQQYRFIIYMARAKLALDRQDMQNFYSGLKQTYFNTVSNFIYYMVVNSENQFYDLYAKDLVEIIQNDLVIIDFLDGNRIPPPLDKPEWDIYGVTIDKLIDLSM